MKYAMALILTLSLSGLAQANNTPVTKSAAPSSDKSITDRQNGQEKSYHGYDSVQTGQSATKKEYQNDSNMKSCRTTGGAWLHAGDAGYAACINDTRIMKK